MWGLVWILLPVCKQPGSHYVLTWQRAETGSKGTSPFRQGPTLMTYLPPNTVTLGFGAQIRAWARLSRSRMDTRGMGRLLGCPVPHTCRWQPDALHFCLLSPRLEPSLHPRGPGPAVLSPVLRCVPTDYATMQAVQATMILSTILCCIAFLIFLLQLFRLKQGERFVLTSIIQLLSCK